MVSDDGTMLYNGILVCDCDFNGAQVVESITGSNSTEFNSCKVSYPSCYFFVLVDTMAENKVGRIQGYM